jgi:CheY-like chemotaxis protein
MSFGVTMRPDRMVTCPTPADAPLILVADDVPANVELLFDQLHVLGFRAVAAYDGPRPLRVCRPASRPLHPRRLDAGGDLGVDDRSTGFEVCRRIKRSAHGGSRSSSSRR